MQTVYYTTDRFIRHTGNLVDLTEYRRRIQQAAVPATEPAVSVAEAPAPARARHRSGWSCPGLMLDFCASMAIVVMTVTVVIQLLVL